MGTALSIDIAANGGFPQPLRSEPLRVVAARHEECGARTEVQIPHSVPARAVRRVRCAGCGGDFEALSIEEVGAHGLARLRNLAAAPSLARLPKLPSLPRNAKFDPSSRFWRVASVPLAAALVIGGLIAIQGGDSASDPAARGAGALAAGGDRRRRLGGAGRPPTGREIDPSAEKPSKHAELIQGSSFHLALPSKWARIEPPSGATFAATAPGGEADATLWIEEDPQPLLRGLRHPLAQAARGARRLGARGRAGRRADARGLARPARRRRPARPADLRGPAAGLRPLPLLPRDFDRARSLTGGARGHRADHRIFLPRGRRIGCWPEGGEPCC